MTPKTYASPAAFKQALESRLRSGSSSGIDFARRRQLLVFDRFLARLAAEFGDAVTLKGGLALEMRLQRARTTRDVDLRLMGPSNDTLERLRAAARRELGDYMVFSVDPDPRHPAIVGEGMRYEGVRFKAACTVAGRVYGQPFGVDIAFGDPMLGEPTRVVAEDWLDFAGVAPPTLRLYPVETHLAEKLHAYTLPRTNPNSRVKDLPDLALIASAEPVEAMRLRAAIAQTFGFRHTHEAPAHLPAPTSLWTVAYAALATESGLAWPTLGDVFDAARAFLDPVLADDSVASWNPATWTWSAASD